MLWFSVWLLLVIGMLTGAVLLARQVWRSGKALLAELERASRVVARLEALQRELAERFPAPVPPRPDLVATAEEKAGFRGARAAHLRAVRLRRTRRLDRALKHWKEVGSPL